MCIVSYMKCIQVLPILKHTFSEELTYWTAQDFLVGDLIQVELNHRIIYAIVSSIVSLSEAKEFIKSREFKIKKIEKYNKVNFFSNAFIRACLHTSKYYVRSFGEILSEYIPKNILENLNERKIVFEKEKYLSDEKNKTRQPIYIQKSLPERIDYLESVIKTYKHACIVVPTDAYKKHILNLTSHIKKDSIEVITPIDLYLLDNQGFDVCILEYAGSNYYKHIRKGFDTRNMVRTYCQMSNTQLIEMDSVLPIYPNILIKDIETKKIEDKPSMYIIDQTISKTAKVQRQSTEKSKLKNKGIQKPEDDVDMRYFMENTLDIVTHKKLKLISPELYSLIVHAEKLSEDIFIYTTRKGLSSSVVCSDCGHVLTCETCKKPFTLIHKKGITSYTCPNGHSSIPIDSTCPVCGSIHMQGLGSGTNALEEELRDVVSMPIITIDGDTVTQAGVRNIFKKRKDKNHTPTIYIGTDLAIHQSLNERFTYGAIASLETLLALPNPTIELEAARTIEFMREKITNDLIIQTRTPTHILWSCLKEKSWISLMQQVQADTQELNLPPHTTHIQLHISKTYKKSEQDICSIQEYLQKHTDLSVTHIEDEMKHVLQIYIHSWLALPTHQSLYKYLKSLPKHIHVEVDSLSFM